MNKIPFKQLDINPYVQRGLIRTITIAVRENTDYVYGELDSLEITDVEDSGLASSVVFSSGTTPTTFTYPSYIEWVNDSIEIEANSKYLLAFCNRIGHLVKIKTINNG